MKSWTLIVSYLWKDTWKRWCEQPGSPLSRLFVTTLLVMVATVILTAFQLVERSLRQRLERFGLDTLLVRTPVTPDSPAFFRHDAGPDAFALLNATGRKLRLRQLFARGQSEWQGNNLPVFAYPAEALPGLRDVLTPHAAAVCVSDDLPREASLEVKIGRRKLVVEVARPPNWLRSLSGGDFLLVPQGWLPDEENLGWVETTVFQRGPDSPPMEKIITSVNVMSALEHRAPPQIQSALPLMRELDELRERHRQWQAVLAAILGGAVALVYGAIAVLEFRQNLFVGALLRSFGAPSWLLYARHWIENAALANLAALAGILLVASLRANIFGAFGLSSVTGLPQMATLITGILAWINLGSFLSSLPVAAGLRQPVGEILS